MQANPERRSLLNLICSSCFGRLNIKTTRADKIDRQKALRDALRSSVSRLLDAPRFSLALVSNRDLTWKGRNHKESEIEQAPVQDLSGDSPLEDAAAQDWSSVGYDPKYRTIRRLNEQEELRYVALAKVGDRFAQQKLVVHHLPLLKLVARRYANRGLALSELVNEGTFGLVRAIDRFDLGRDLRFGTYAKWWIRDAMEQALLKQSRIIRLPGHVVRSMREQHRAEEQEAEALRMGMVDETEDAEASLPDAIVHEAELEPVRQTSLEHNADEAAWDDRCDSKANGADETTPEMILDDKQRHEFLMRGMSELSERERLVLTRRFGLNNDEPDTLEDVAADLGVSYERVRQIQKTALTKLKSYLALHCGAPMW